jgi:esterase/lipase
MTKVYFKNKNNERLCGILVKKDKNKPIVIICHGYNVDKNRLLYKYISKRLNENNISTLRFDFSGYGESKGRREDAVISKEISDLESAINYTYNNGLKNIVLLGHSLGGSICIIEAAKNKKIIAVISLASVTYIQKMKGGKFSEEVVTEVMKKGKLIYKKGKKKYILTKEFFEDLEKYDVLDLVKKIKVPILVLHGKNDEKINYKEAKKLYDNSKKLKKLMIIKGADHKFSSKESREQIVKSVIKFLSMLNNKA